MATVRVEWIYLGKGGYAENVIKKVLGGLSVTGITAAPAAATEIPDGHVDGDLYARMTAEDVPVHVAWGDNPTASLTNGLKLYVGIPEVIAVDSDWKLSFRTES